MHFLYFFWFTYVCHATGPHVSIYFYLHSPNFRSFSFYLQSHFHSVFCLVFLHLVTEFEMDLYNISSPRSQVRALHFCLFTVWLASISVGPRLNKNKLKEVHQLHVDVLFGFYVPFWQPSYMGNSTEFSQTPLPQTTFFYISLYNLVLLLPSIFLVEPSKLLQSKFISSPPKKQFRTAELQFRLGIH